jgi:hypothetical protein
MTLGEAITLDQFFGLSCDSETYTSLTARGTEMVQIRWIGADPDNYDEETHCEVIFSDRDFNPIERVFTRKQVGILWDRIRSALKADSFPFRIDKY